MRSGEIDPAVLLEGMPEAEGTWGLLATAMEVAAALPWDVERLLPFQRWSWALHQRLDAAGLGPEPARELTRRATFAVVERMVRREYHDHPRRPVDVALAEVLPTGDPALAATLLALHDALERSPLLPDFLLALWREAAEESGGAGMAGEVPRRAILRALFRRAARAGLFVPGDPATRPTQVRPGTVLASFDGALLFRQARLFFDFALEGIDHGPDPHIVQLIAVADLVRERLAATASPVRTLPDLLRYISQGAETLQLWPLIFDWGWAPGFSNPVMVTAHLRVLLPDGDDQARAAARQSLAARRATRRATT